MFHAGGIHGWGGNLPSESGCSYKDGSSTPMLGWVRALSKGGQCLANERYLLLFMVPYHKDRWERISSSVCDKANLLRRIKGAR